MACRVVVAAVVGVVRSEDLNSLSAECRDLIDLIFNLSAHAQSQSTHLLAVVSTIFLPITVRPAAIAGFGFFGVDGFGSATSIPPITAGRRLNNLLPITLRLTCGSPQGPGLGVQGSGVRVEGLGLPPKTCPSPAELACGHHRVQGLGCRGFGGFGVGLIHHHLL